MIHQYKNHKPHDQTLLRVQDAIADGHSFNSNSDFRQNTWVSPFHPYETKSARQDIV